MSLGSPISPQSHNASATLVADPLATATHNDFKPLAILVGMAFFMEQLDSTIISPVIPELAAAFQVEPLQLSLTMTIYLLCSLAFIPFGGALIARFGTRTVFRGAILTFSISSLLCALSTELWQLTAARALQGVAAALVVPVGRSTIVWSVPKAQLVKALAWMITPAMVGPMLGPPLGGAIATWLSWEWIFLINVPVGLAGYYWASRVIPQIQEKSGTPLRWLEWVLVTLFLIMVLTLLEGSRGLIDPQWIPFAFGALLVLGGLCIFYYRHQNQPMLNFRLLGVRSFAAGFWGGSLVRVGYGALPFLLPLMLQIGMGFSALQSGIILLLSGLIAFFTKTKTANMLKRWGFRKVLLSNGAMCGVALLACSGFGWSNSGSIYVISVIVCVAGFARSVQFNALTAIAYADLPPSDVSSATTINTMGWQLAIMMGISIASWIVDTSSSLAQRSQPVGIDFAIAFAALGIVALVSMYHYARLPANAGQALSGCTHK